MALIFTKKEVSYKELIKFEGYNVDPFELILDEEQEAEIIGILKTNNKYKQEDLASLNDTELNELKLANDRLVDLIWGNKKDYYLHGLGEYLFQKYSIAVGLDIAGKYSAQNKKLYENIAKKYQAKK